MLVSEELLKKLENSIHRLALLNVAELEVLAQDIREYVITVVKNNGGHLSSNLGVVELTLALYKTFQFPKDSLLFDVSHQAYIHKILSDRLYQFQTIRTKGGLSGFTQYTESPYDITHVAHAGTAISSAMGLHKAKQFKGDHSFTLAIIGDASIANGVSFEALNNIDILGLNRLIIILNDNQMSISKAVGSFSKLLTQIISHPFYNKSRKRMKKILARFGQKPNHIIGSFLARIKSLVFNNYFENFGVRYIGPVDGHNLVEMISLFENIRNYKSKIDKPLLIHILTTKGKGYKDSELYPDTTHGIGPKQKGEQLNLPSYSQVLEKEIIHLQHKYGNITATTAAMSKGTGLEAFAQKYPNHFFDVGIAESHAVAFSSFLNSIGAYKPYIAIYSTFFQRAIDQVFQDVCLQKLAPVFILDRAGLVGEDGATHHGLYDIAYLKAFPRLILCSPISQTEFEALLDFAYHQTQPIVIRIPKALAIPHPIELSSIQLGKGYWVKKLLKPKAIIIVYGPIIKEILDIQTYIEDISIINILFAKPLDQELLLEASDYNVPIITLEEHSIIGGIGESIASYIASLGKAICVHSLGVPDQFIEHATRDEQLEELHLKGDKILSQIISLLSHS